MLLEERQRKPSKEAGRIIIVDWFTPAILTDNEVALIKFTEIPLKSFVNEFNDYVVQGMKIFNMVNSREALVALKVAGVKLPDDRVEMPVEDIRYITPGSLIFYVYINEKGQEPLKVYKVELKS